LKNRYYVYILNSLKDITKSYIGFTGDINRRLQEHNSGNQTYTKRYSPWELETCITFSDKEKAQEFELYLKGGSGKAFIKNHF